MAKKNGKIKIQEERAKRQQQLAQVRQEKMAVQNRLSELNTMELKLMGALEELDALDEIGNRTDGQAQKKAKVKKEA